MNRLDGILLMLVCSGSIFSQPTQIDLRLQSKNIDFSNANATKPFKASTGLPGICSIGEMFYKLDAPAGSNLFACTSQNTWTLQQGGGGSSGASMAAQLGDFLVTRASATNLSIGGNCSATVPCSARFGNLVYSFPSGGSALISGGTGTAFIYISGTGILTVGHNLTATCSAVCVAQSGVTSFPPDAIPLFVWSATAGSWDLNGGMDQRAVLASKVVAPGTGLASTETSGKTVLSIDPTAIALRTSVPPASNSTCASGAWAMDNSFYYLCVGTNVWRRVGLSTW
jgi:hypothetical protein